MPVVSLFFSRHVEQEESCGGLHSFDLFRLSLPEPPLADEYPEYLGCYADDKQDRVMTHKIALETMTPTRCREHCQDKDAMYYGTQVGVRADVAHCYVCRHCGFTVF